MEQLTITEKNGENYILLEVKGAVNAYTGQEFKNKVNSSIIDTNLVLDLSDVSVIDSTGMGIIMAAFNDGADSGNRLFLLNPSSVVRQAVEDTGFLDFFTFIHSVTEVIS
jgi:anti-sigma B factor antagonist